MPGNSAAVMALTEQVKKLVSFITEYNLTIFAKTGQLLTFEVPFSVSLSALVFLSISLSRHGFAKVKGTLIIILSRIDFFLISPKHVAKYLLGQHCTTLSPFAACGNRQF